MGSSEVLNQQEPTGKPGWREAPREYDLSLRTQRNVSASAHVFYEITTTPSLNTGKGIRYIKK